MKRKSPRKGRKTSSGRRFIRRLGLVVLALFVVWGAVADWFVHHSPEWIAEQSPLVSAPMLWLGNPVADVTDALDLTGYDTVCEYDRPAPSGSVTFAGIPHRVNDPAPEDIRIIDRGEFKIGWSDRLRHPVWCAYHVTREALHVSEYRPGFTRDREVAAAPSPDEYSNSGYDRGHLAPNYAIVTRYGESAQKKTFMMTNIAPQSPALNRGVWRDVEHRIADLWTARYGEIWVIVGAIPAADGVKKRRIGRGSIDVPAGYYQVIVAQEGDDVRMLALKFDQDVAWNAWAARHIVTVRELERLTGLDFNPELPSFIQEPLETDRPNRLWPICKLDVLRQLAIRFK